MRALTRWAPRTAVRALALEGELLGAAGEALAARALCRRGWRILGRRVATPEAEVDLVALDGGTLVVVEVKAGRSAVGPERLAGSDRWRPGHRFGAPHLERCRRAAARIASRSGGRPWRVDLVELVLFPGGAMDLHHHPDRTRPLARPDRSRHPHRNAHSATTCYLPSPADLSQS